MGGCCGVGVVCDRKHERFVQVNIHVCTRVQLRYLLCECYTAQRSRVVEDMLHHMCVVDPYQRWARRLELILACRMAVSRFCMRTWAARVAAWILRSDFSTEADALALIPTDPSPGGEAEDAADRDSLAVLRPSGSKGPMPPKRSLHSHRTDKRARATMGASVGGTKRHATLSMNAQDKQKQIPPRLPQPHTHLERDTLSGFAPFFLCCFFA
mgnify:CR=1 FL=1